MTSVKGNVWNASLGAAGVLLRMNVGEDISAVGVQVVSAGVATITYEVSNDDVTYTAIVGYDPASANPSWASTTTTVCLRIFPVQGFKWFRARISAYTSGTVTAAVALNTAAVAQGPVTGTVTVNSLPASSNTIGGVFGGGNTSGNGLTNFRLAALATAGGDVRFLKASAGKLCGGFLQNTSAALKYVKFYQKASAPVVATDVPIIVIALAAGQTFFLADVSDLYGVSFTTGIAFAITGGIANTDATAVAANDVIGLLQYI